MRITISLFACVALSTACLAADAAGKAALVVFADQGTATISRNIYGRFSEHLGSRIYGGLWAGEDGSIPTTRGIRDGTAGWIEYIITCDGKSPMADRRRANGREQPWKLEYFGVGDENWGCGGNMRPECYADQYRRFQTCVRNCSGNRMHKIASGFTATLPPKSIEVLELR